MQADDFLYKKYLTVLKKKSITTNIISTYLHQKLVHFLIKIYDYKLLKNLNLCAYQKLKSIGADG